MMKLDANIEAVILRQSVQWQRKVSTRPGASVGWMMVIEVNIEVILVYSQMIAGQHRSSRLLLLFLLQTSHLRLARRLEYRV